MYRFCKLFGATPAEYQQRPWRETTLLLAIDDTYNKARAKEMGSDGQLQV